MVEDDDNDDGRTPDHGHPISSPCEPNGSGELKTNVSRLLKDLIELQLVLIKCNDNVTSHKDYIKIGQVSLTATVTCNQYYLLSCGADGAR